MCILALMFLMSGAIISFPSVVISDVDENNSTIYGDYISFTDSQKDSLGESVVNMQEFLIEFIA